MAGGTWTPFAPRVAVSDHEHGEFVRLLIGAAPAATDYFDGKGATSFYVPKTDTVNWVALGKSDGERFVLSVFQQALRGGTMCGRIGRKLREPAGSEHLPDVLDVDIQRRPYEEIPARYHGQRCIPASAYTGGVDAPYSKKDSPCFLARFTAGKYVERILIDTPIAHGRIRVSDSLTGVGRNYFLSSIPRIIVFEGDEFMGRGAALPT